MDVVGHLLSVSFYEGLAYGFVAIGVYLTFRVLGFPDLTVDGSFPLGGAVAAVLIVAGANPWLATLAALAAGLVAGTCTALLNTKLRISALLSGILVMVALYSVNLLIMGRANISLLRDITVFEQFSAFLGIKTGLTLSIILLAILSGATLLFLNWFLRTDIGLALRATGDNEQMVRGLGTDTDMTTIMGVALSNGMVSFAGALISQNQGVADVGMGVGMIVMGLASVIVGEGVFRPKGITWILLAVFGGAFLYRLFLSIVLQMGLAPANLKLVTALLVVAALVVPYIQKKLRHEWIPPAVRM